MEGENASVRIDIGRPGTDAPVESGTGKRRIKVIEA